MRLVFPEVQNDAQVEIARAQTQRYLNLAVDFQVRDFTESPARYLFNMGSDTEKKLRSLYQEAADISYHLWNRRTALKISARDDLNRLFDIDDPKMALHSMVNEDTKDKLTGQPITLFVHPMIGLFGTEEGY